MSAWIRLLRPHQWVKNLFVVAPVVFAKELLESHEAWKAAAAFALFSCLASAVYVLNDLADIDADRVHPEKRKRPLPSGRISVPTARITSLALLGTAAIGSIWLSSGFAIFAGLYFVLNVAYSRGLKRIPYVDALCIALGFELRVLAGAEATQITPSRYLLIVTFLLAAFLALGKRLHELSQGERASKQRSVLRMYNPRVLDLLLALFATATITVYLIYSLDENTKAFFGTDYFGLTIVFVAFGIVRFLLLARNKGTYESPTEAMLKDVPFLANLFAWTTVVLLIVYV